MKTETKNRNIFLILSLFVLILGVIITAGTYAYWSWQNASDENTNIVFTMEEDFSCSVDGGGYISSGEIVMVPTSCTNSEHVIKREVTVNANVSNPGTMVHMDLWIDINSMDTELSNSSNLRYALTSDETSCDENVLMSGNFSNKTANDTATILMKDFNASATETYYLWVWLDSAETNVNTAGKSFGLSLNGECMNTTNDAYAIYSADDNSLTFYKETEDITVGSQYNGKTVTALYTGFENTTYGSETEVPWDSYRASITSVVFEDTIAPINTAYWFYNFSNCTSMDLEKIDTSNVTSMVAMFQNMNSLTNLDVSHFNTSQVISMRRMFSGVSSLTNLDVSNFNTSQTNEMQYMFRDMSLLTNLNLTNFDTAKVTSMYAMFQNMNSLTNLDVSHFNTSKVTNMRLMFQGCSNLTSLDLSSFNTTNVTDMYGMFSGVSSLTSLDLSSFNTSKVTDMYGMFFDCRSLTSLDLSKFNTSQVTNMSHMFTSCFNLESLNVSSFNTSKVTNMNFMFFELSNMSNLNLSSFDTKNVTTAESMFQSCNTLYNLDLRNADFSNVSSFTYMFSGVPGKASIIVKDSTQQTWITSRFTNLTNVVLPS